MSVEKYDTVYYSIMKVLRPLEFDEALRVLGGLTTTLIHSIPETNKRAEIMGSWVESLMDAELNLQQWEDERRRKLH